MSEQGVRVDARSARFGQILTGTFSVTAFVADAPVLVLIVGAVLTFAAVFGARWNVWGLLFTRVVRPFLPRDAPVKTKPGAPLRFANLVGAVFLVAATILFYGGLCTIIAWTLVLVVAALALLAAATEFCVGCELYVLWIRLTTRHSGSA